MTTKSQAEGLKSAVATAMAAALLVTSPGPLAVRAYAQLAAGAAASGRAVSTVPGAVGASAQGLSVPGSLSAPSVSVSLSPSLPTPSAVLPNAITPAQTSAAPAAASAAAAAALPAGTRAAPAKEAPETARPASSKAALEKAAAAVAPSFKSGAAPRSERAASSLNAVFDANVRKAAGASDAVVQGRAGRAVSALKPGPIGQTANECSGGGCSVPTPAKAQPGAKASFWQSPWVRFGAPAAVIGATALFFHASLLPVAVISGSLMFSILAHESAHILGLRIYGDPSPKEAGRDHLNPFMHIDPFGTILVPAVSLAVSQAVLGFPILFGWAKPVPVDFNNLKDVQHDAAKVAAMGPLTNAAIAALAFGALWALPALGLMSSVGTGALILSTLWKMNLALTLFNILPLPWLDGGKLLVATFSKSAYARWTANPNLPEGYQGIFRRIYEGPANILTRFNVKTLGQVNAITRVATFGALGAFYALFFTTLQFPLLFLALPCSYDYWCIREKVRSEEAVEEMMDLMSQWGTALVQIAEDHDAESEVSAYEAEHAMKNAVDQLLEDLMAKEEFRNLTDEEKIAEFMRAYPGMAAKFLKEKVLTQDSEEKIRQILADARNNPFMARLEKWLKDHKVFEKMHSPHAKKKLKDSMKEADEKRARGAGGTPLAAFAPLLLLSLAAAGMPGLEFLGAGALTPALQLAAALGIGGALLGTIDRVTGAEPAPKWTRNGTMSSELEFWVNVGTPENNPTYEEQQQFLRFHGFFDGTNNTVRSWEWINGYRLKVLAHDAEQSERLIRASATDNAVTSISVHPDMLNRLTLADALEAAPAPAPAPKTLSSKVAADESLAERKTLRIDFAENASDSAKRNFIDTHVRSRALRYRWENGSLHVLLREMRFGPALTEAAQAEDKVAAVKVSAAGLQALEEYLSAQPALFDHSVVNPDTHSELQGADEARGVLVVARDGASLEDLKAWAEGKRLRLVEADYRGMAGLHLFEAADAEDPAWTISSLAGALTDADPAASLRPLSEAAAAPEAPASVEPAAPAEPAAPQRRDAHAAWLNFLQTQTLADGKSTLTPKQAGLVAEFLKPVVPPAGRKKHPVIGRVKEMKTVIPILTAPRDMINSAMLVGPAGTGKTAVFEGLAELMEDAQNQDAVRVEGTDGPAWLDIRRLRGRWFVQLDIDRLLAADEPIKVLLALVDLLPLLNSADPRDGNRLIILADEMQKLRMDPQGVKIMNALKGPIRDGQISVAGTTTDKEWKEYFDSDDALKSRFEKVNIEEPSVGETAEMLHGAKSYYEWKHDTAIEDDALDAAAKLTDQFDKENHNPRKSVKLVEQAAEDARPDNRRASLALEIREGWRKLGVLVSAAAKDMAKKGVASALTLPVEAYNRIAGLVSDIVGAHEEQRKVSDGRSVVDIDLIKRKLAKKTGISAGQLTLGDEDASRYVNMEAEVSKRVVNQERAIRALANAIRRNKSGLSNPHRPMGKFLFVGPTGTGKTHLVKELARFLFKDPEAYVRFDMSEFMEEHTYMRLVGAPPSYVGYGAGGQLTEAVRKRPYSVILLDEIEKAHPKVWDIFLQILDDGRLTDSEGRTVDFKNTVIIMTSNTGMAAVDSQKYERMLTRVWEQLKALDEAEDPALVAARVEKGVSLLKESRDAELAAVEARYAKALADLDEAAAETTDLGQVLKARQMKDAMKAKLEAELEAAAAKHARLIDAKRAELAAKFGGGDRAARRAELSQAADEIEKAWDAEIALAIQEGVMQRFRPEFINRLDEDPDSKNKWVIFNRLKKENIGLIAKLQVKEFVDLLSERHGTELVLGDDVMDLLVEYGFSPLYGARPMQAAVEKFIIDPLARWVLDMAQKGESAAERRIKVSVEGGTTRFEMLEKPQSVIEKRTLEGAAQALTREVMELAETRAAAALGQAEKAPEPSESFFDGLLKKVLGTPESPAAEKAVPVFNPGTAYPGAKGTALEAEHNDPARKDKAMRAAIEDLTARAKQAGAAPETVDVLAPEAGKPGEGWLKHFIRHAKTEATKAGAEAPVFVSYEAGQDAVRVKVHSAHRMSEAEAEALRVHFTGNPPKDLKAAQQQADGVNMTATLLRDHNLLDIYRRLSAIPGARFGYATGEKGTDYWLELPLRGSLPVAGAAPSAPTAEPALTPHQARERAKTKALFLQLIRSQKQKDNPNVEVAAASGFGALATPDDLPQVRAWIVEKGWADRDSTGSRLTDSWPLLMAMALVMKRYGTAADLPVLERILRLYTSTSHFHIPAKMALVDAVGTLMSRSGAEHARAVYEAAAKDRANLPQLKEGAQLALGKVGELSDLPSVADEGFKEVNPDALIELLERVDPARLRAFFEAHWPPQPDAQGKLSGAPFKGWDSKQKILILKLVGRGYGHPGRDLALLKEVLNGTLNSDRVTHYHAAEAYSLVAAGMNLGGNLQRFLEEFLEKHDFTSYDDKWPVLMAYLYTIQKVGGPAALSALEHAMKKDAGRISSNYEQAFFELPVTWAKAMVRSGLFARYAEPGPAGEDGRPGPSKLQLMLAAKEPMLVAAALYAIALEQQRLGGRGREADVEPRPQGPLGDLPDLYVPGSSSPGSGGGAYYGDQYFDEWGPDGTFSHIPPGGVHRWRGFGRPPLIR